MTEQRRGLLLGLGIVLMAVVATSYACTSSGTSTMVPFEVRVVNDHDGLVRLAMCQDGDCGVDREEVEVAPGGEVTVDAITDGNARPVRVTDAEGEVVGCLPFVSRSVPPVEDLEVAVSDAVPCGDDFGMGTVTGPDWPAPD